MIGSSFFIIRLSSFLGVLPANWFHDLECGVVSRSPSISISLPLSSLSLIYTRISLIIPFPLFGSSFDFEETRTHVHNNVTDRDNKRQSRRAGFSNHHHASVFPASQPSVSLLRVRHPSRCTQSPLFHRCAPHARRSQDARDRLDHLGRVHSQRSGSTRSERCANQDGRCTGIRRQVSYLLSLFFFGFIPLLAAFGSLAGPAIFSSRTSIVSVPFGRAHGWLAVGCWADLGNVIPAVPVPTLAACFEFPFPLAVTCTSILLSPRSRSARV